MYTQMAAPIHQKRSKNILRRLLFHEKLFHLLAGIRFTIMGKQKEQVCEQELILLFIWGFLVQNSDKNYE